MADIAIDRDGLLRVDGVVLVRVAETRIDGGGMTLSVVQPEGTSDSEAVFDGWQVWQLEMDLQALEPRDGGRARYEVLAALEAVAREMAGEVPAEHSFGGDLARALKVSRVLVERLAPIRDSAEHDTLNLTMMLRQVDPRVAIVERQRREPVITLQTAGETGTALNDAITPSDRDLVDRLTPGTA